MHPDPQRLRRSRSSRASAPTSSTHRVVVRCRGTPSRHPADARGGVRLCVLRPRRRPCPSRASRAPRSVSCSPGDVFGEMAFFSDGRRTADVFADTEVRVFAMFGTRFRRAAGAGARGRGRLEVFARGRTGQTGSGRRLTVIVRRSRARTRDHRLQLAVGDVARQVLHAAVRRRDQFLHSLVGQRAADPVGDGLGQLDGQVVEVDHAEDDRACRAARRSPPCQCPTAPSRSRPGRRRRRRARAGMSTRRVGRG